MVRDVAAGDSAANSGSGWTWVTGRSCCGRKRPVIQYPESKTVVCPRFCSDPDQSLRRNATSVSPSFVRMVAWPPAAMTTYCLPLRCPV